jgi:hypothetical protein
MHLEDDLLKDLACDGNNYDAEVVELWLWNGQAQDVHFLLDGLEG